MTLFSKTFTNERGNEILLTIHDGRERGTVVITMRGPHSQSVDTMTWQEAAELREALKRISL
ncbi:hypothetical protein [Bradyrhizobium sp. SZCCHNRI1073]|uniref:hypothetical protein n=1 Tax=Bradyrhizobium sp. SZCCHNRI1073 TaxID=3057280 RepID=UPI002915EDFD|nr:hypothetical protein [Bradyrhizobium sp. SZCCHNRI1073]